MMQENGLINHWFGQQQFNLTIKNSLMAHNSLINIMNCMINNNQPEKKLQTIQTKFLEVKLKGLRMLFYIILGGLSLSIVILLSEITAFHFG